MYSALHCYRRAREAPAQSYSVGHNSALLLTHMHQKYLSTLRHCTGENNEFCMASPPKTKVPGLWRRLVLWCPPESTPDPPRGTPRLKLLRAERRCLPASSRTCYSIFMCGFQGKTHSSNTAKSQTQSTSFFGYGGPFDVCRGALSWKKRKENRHSTVFSFVVQRMNPPAVSP